MSEGKKPWAFIAHRDGKWSGVTVADTADKKSLGKFLGDMAARGCAIMTVYSREEYEAALAQRKR